MVLEIKEIHATFKDTFPESAQPSLPQGSFHIEYPATNKTADCQAQLSAQDCLVRPLVKATIPISDKAERYTLIMSDIDASAEGCHYLATNLKASVPENQALGLEVQNFNSDDIVDILPYVAPGPRIEQNHRYVWLLFQGTPNMEQALKVRDCRRGYGMNEKGYGAEWFQKVAGLGKLVAFSYHFVKNDNA